MGRRKGLEKEEGGITFTAGEEAVTFTSGEGAVTFTAGEEGRLDPITGVTAVPVSKKYVMQLKIQKLAARQ